MFCLLISLVIFNNVLSTYKPITPSKCSTLTYMTAGLSTIPCLHGISQLKVIILNLMFINPFALCFNNFNGSLYLYKVYVYMFIKVISILLTGFNLLKYIGFFFPLNNVLLRFIQLVLHHFS